MPESLCEKYGFDHKRRQQRLSEVGLTATDLQLAQELNAQIVAPNVQDIVAEFYAYLLSQDAALRFLDTGPRIKRLKRMQTDYLLSLGQQFDQAAYFEERLRIGQVHEKTGLPVNLYLSAYGWLEARFSVQIVQSSALDALQRETLLSFLIRIMTLDMTLAMETYFFEHVGNLEARLSALTSQRDELTKQVDQDALTGVASRSFILSQLERQNMLRRKTDGPLCVIMADLDFFKQVNDEHGHLVGDRVLREVGRRLKSAIRQVDWVGRYGGEEFLLVLPGTHLEMANMIAERARQSIASTPIHTQDATVSMTISMGVTEAQAGESIRALIERADEALYLAKQAGRNCTKLR